MSNLFSMDTKTLSKEEAKTFVTVKKNPFVYRFYKCYSQQITNDTCSLPVIFKRLKTLYLLYGKENKIRFVQILNIILDEKKVLSKKNIENIIELIDLGCYDNNESEEDLLYSEDWTNALNELEDEE